MHRPPPRRPPDRDAVAADTSTHPEVARLTGIPPVGSRTGVLLLSRKRHRMLTGMTHGRAGAAVLRLPRGSDLRTRCVHRGRERFGPHGHSVPFALMFARDHLEAW